MERRQFERLLGEVVRRLGRDVRDNATYHSPNAFEDRVLEVLQDAAQDMPLEVKETFHPHAFPDIVGNGFGVEVKTTKKDEWKTTGNVIFEGMRDPEVGDVYVVFGNMGGTPEVRWEKYDQCVRHVRVSHQPRFEIEIGCEKPLFSEMGVPYSQFYRLSNLEKMRHVRQWAETWMTPGQRLWWLEGFEEEGALPLEVSLYMALPRDERRILRAEAALLCPQIVGKGKYKYADAALYLLTYHGILSSQTRDMFSAGSVALEGDERRGGSYLLRGLLQIQDEMRAAAFRLEDALFVEFWGESVPPENRIQRWLQLADNYALNAVDWRPSRHLFLPDQAI